MLSLYGFRFEEKGADDGWGYFATNPTNNYDVLANLFFGVPVSYANSGFTAMDSAAIGVRATIWASTADEKPDRAYYYGYSKTKAWPSIYWYRNHGFSLCCLKILYFKSILATIVNFIIILVF